MCPDSKPLSDWLRDLMALKRTPRTGWLRLGVARWESVAEHSYAAALLAWRLAKERHLDAEKVLLMALLHDFHEARLGDIPSPIKAELPRKALAETEARLIRQQWAQVLPEVGELLAELEGGQSEEAQLVRAVDKAEMLLQAREYMAAGHADARAWIEAAAKDAALDPLRREPWLRSLLEAAADGTDDE